MPAVYQQFGVRFLYPENWSVLDEETDEWPRAVTLQSEETGFWTLQVYPPGFDAGQAVLAVVEFDSRGLSRSRSAAGQGNDRRCGGQGGRYRVFLSRFAGRGPLPTVKTPSGLLALAFSGRKPRIRSAWSRCFRRSPRACSGRTSLWNSGPAWEKLRNFAGWADLAGFAGKSVRSDGNGFALCSGSNPSAASCFLDRPSGCHWLCLALLAAGGLRAGGTRTLVIACPSPATAAITWAARLGRTTSTTSGSNSPAWKRRSRSKECSTAAIHQQIGDWLVQVESELFFTQPLRPQRARR